MHVCTGGGGWVTASAGGCGAGGGGYFFIFAWGYDGHVWRSSAYRWGKGPEWSFSTFNTVDVEDDLNS